MFVNGGWVCDPAKTDQAAGYRIEVDFMAAVKFKKGDKKIKMRIENAWKKELAPLSEVILKDCNSFCPQDQKALIASSYQASDLKNGILKWDAPNAK